MPSLIMAPSFSAWMSSFGKTYATREELTHRRSIYAGNVALVNAHNAGITHASEMTLGATIWADLSAEEYRAMLEGSDMQLALPRSAEEGHLPQGVGVAALPASVDWCGEGVVGPVMNQGQLGAAWAYAAEEVIESNAAIATGNFRTLSAQQLASCTTQDAWQKYTLSHGLCSAAD